MYNVHTNGLLYLLSQTAPCILFLRTNKQVARKFLRKKGSTKQTKRKLEAKPEDTVVVISNSIAVFHNTACKKKKGITGPANFIQTIVCGVEGMTFSCSSSCCQDYLTSFGLKTWSFGRLPPAWCWDPTGPWEGGAPAVGKGCSHSREVVEVPVSLISAGEGGKK